MFNLIASNPFVMALAIIGFMNATVTIEDGYTGVVLRGENIVRHLPPGTHFRLPQVEQVIPLNTEISHQQEIIHQAQLSNSTSCKYRVLYGFIVEDTQRAVATLQYGQIRKLKPALLDARVRDMIDELALETTVKDLEGPYKDRFRRHMRDLGSTILEDGTRGRGFHLASIDCDGPEAIRALEMARRPKSKPGPTIPINGLSRCGKWDDQAKALEVPTVRVLDPNDVLFDILDLEVFYRSIDDTLSESHPAIVQNLVSQTLRNQLRGYDSADIGRINICPLLVDNSDLDTSLEQFGVKLVALNPDTPQYAIHEPIEYQDDPAD